MEIPKDKELDNVGSFLVCNNPFPNHHTKLPQETQMELIPICIALI